jgi:hypothetical protein
MVHENDARRMPFLGSCPSLRPNYSKAFVVAYSSGKNYAVQHVSNHQSNRAISFLSK